MTPSSPPSTFRSSCRVATIVENWSSVFEGVPDFSSELIASSVDGDTEWGEWSWQGHHVDGDIDAAVQELYKPPPGSSQRSPT